VDKKTLIWCAQQCADEADLMDRLGETYPEGSRLECAQSRRASSLRCMAETLEAQARKTPKEPKVSPRCDRGIWVCVGINLTMVAILLSKLI